MSHSQFANDTIFFPRASFEELHSLKLILLVFGRLLGLRINLNKSTLSGINISQNQTARLTSLLDCAISDWPLSYLGLPLGGNPTQIQFLFGTRCWMESLGGWMDGKKTFLSLGGRNILIQSCLSHIPNYFLSLLRFWLQLLQG